MASLLSVSRIIPNVYCVSENYYKSWNKANLYLFNGTQRDILVDTGTGLYNTRELLDELGLISSEKPVVAVATHVHYDHCGGHEYFSDFRIHSSDADGLINGCPKKMLPFVADCDVTPKPYPSWTANDYKISPRPREKFTILDDGDILNLGPGHDVQIIHLPGHTPGSIGVLDVKNKLLCSGDMFFDNAPMIDYLPGQSSRKHFVDSINKIMQLLADDRVQLILPGHGDSFDKEKALILAERYLQFNRLCGEQFFAYF